MLFLILKKKIVTNKISLLIPTRERVLKFDRFISSVIENTQNISRCEILVLIDIDDPEKDKYFELIDKLKEKINIKIFNETLSTMPKETFYKTEFRTILFPRTMI